VLRFLYVCLLSVLVARPQKSNHLFGVDDSGKMFFVVDDRERPQIVLVEELGHFSSICIDVAGDQVALRQVRQRFTGRGEEKLHQRN
jgi:hypothetical protein